ncbi:MAG TPA: hypothetical protein PLJ71_15435 [Candidatus Hydrogenedentes bacterium]|nr:hypothetical protein [Candidatus Hydrogenedentota bacterium]HQM50079.1 hypothetical protein [Candidatus Hydrogenedentota bacterium]
MAATGEKARFRRFVRRWGILLGVCLALGVLAALDRHLKRADRPIGFHPADAACVAVSADFPSFCARLAASDAAERFMSETPRPFEAFELAVRKATGVRPTPLRWSVWLGPRLVWSRWNHTQGICVHPGLLLRLAHSLRVLGGARPNAGGLYSFAGQFYAWRDRFLIISPAPEYVRAALEASPLDAASFDGSDRLCMRWAGGTVQISPEPNIPVTGMLNTTLTPADDGLLLKDDWPETALFSLTTHSLADASDICRIARRPLENNSIYNCLAPLTGAVRDRWALESPAENWPTHVAECSLALMDVDTAGTVPIPEWGAMLRRASSAGVSGHPWKPVIAPLAPVDYAWNGREGAIATLLGEKFAICLAEDGDRWLATSRQDLMNDLLATERAGARINADAALQINWDAVGRAAEKILRKAGELQLVPEMNAQEVDVYLGKYARSIARLGRLRIVAHVRHDGVAFEGTLVSPLEEVPARP